MNAGGSRNSDRSTPNSELLMVGRGWITLRLRPNGVAAPLPHVGLDTFKPVQVDEIADHPIHSEWAEVSLPAAERINQTKLSGGRVIAIGTTAVRTLETAA